MELNENECMKNGYYCNGHKLAKVRDELVNYAEKHGLDIMDLCRKVMKATNGYVYSFDNAVLVDIDTIEVSITKWYNNLFDFDTVRISK